MFDRGIRLFSGNANPALGQKIADNLGVPLGRAKVGRFSDGEVSVEIRDNVRGPDIFLIQPTCRPTADNFMELVVMVDALKRASARTVTAVIPYFGYARQDRKDKPRVSIGAKLVADLLSAAGVDRIITMDLHADQIQGFFDVPVDHLYASALFVPYIESLGLDKIIIASLDYRVN